jgi:hypothetical protein
MNNKTSQDSPTLTSTTNSTSSSKKKKPFVERIGDWNCFKCKNLNFSFRVNCNRCQLSKKDSEKSTNEEGTMKNNFQFINLLTNGDDSENEEDFLKYTHESNFENSEYNREL